MNTSNTMNTDAMLKHIRHLYKQHLHWSNELTKRISTFFAEKGQGCTVLINENLQIEIEYMPPRDGRTPISTLIKDFHLNVSELCDKNILQCIYEKSEIYDDYLLPEEYSTFYVEKVILDEVYKK